MALPPRFRALPGIRVCTSGARKARLGLRSRAKRKATRVAMEFSLVFLFVTNLVLLSWAAAAYTPPSTLSKFHSVLARAKLQAPNSKTAVRDLFGYGSWYFHLQDDTYMQFQIKKSGQRSELRQNWTTGELADWSTTDEERCMYAEVALPTPDPEMDEFTFLQIHCTVKPLLRVTWRRSFEDESDVIAAVVRNGFGDGEVDKYLLSSRSSATTSFKVLVSRNKMSVWVGGSQKLSSIDVSVFENDDCYFKAGAYIQHERSDEAIARTKFKELKWWC